MLCYHQKIRWRFQLITRETKVRNVDNKNNLGAWTLQLETLFWTADAK